MRANNEIFEGENRWWRKRPATKVKLLNRAGEKKGLKALLNDPNLGRGTKRRGRELVHTAGDRSLKGG